ncbi:hypothetical protein RRG08_037179 [Elysia crispata]|uniref:Uncharacterized protein n=1 Tax=Elysia crispata TaxID=231223 RepID=A0AAE0Z4E7_9GAST|nr:hypothetical protein RRG08_037179 [Elysia crispata]
MKETKSVTKCPQKRRTFIPEVPNITPAFVDGIVNILNSTGIAQKAGPIVGCVKIFIVVKERKWDDSTACAFGLGSSKL